MYAPYSGTSEQGTLWGRRFCPLYWVVPISEVKIIMHFGVETSILCKEVIPISEGPLSEVPL